MLAGSSAQVLLRLYSRCWAGLGSRLGLKSLLEVCVVVGRSHYLAGIELMEVVSSRPEAVGTSLSFMGSTDLVRSTQDNLHFD